MSKINDITMQIKQDICDDNDDYDGNEYGE